jgi:hypothetical protein
MLMRPTDDSGFAWVLAENIRLTASAWASNLDGLRKVLLAMRLGRGQLGDVHIVTISTALAVVNTVGG